MSFSYHFFEEVKLFEKYSTQTTGILEAKQDCVQSTGFYTILLCFVCYKVVLHIHLLPKQRQNALLYLVQDELI